ncbi:hypothetical protein DER29_4357 [Micromonospora sp. M71_S20]|uniref:hypothetical protein n=1 Tax=Micromonospora sp. M71_S20 TaxID=592872 RepID=UPI000EB1C355|nr:hypothetical protein [Micromonospora sp. M71_S20]RLK13339.1 hypothetical protein DER29_4357 [Micromonospora sp. M71_S20]
MTETVARQRHEALRIRIDRLTYGLDRGVWYRSPKVNIRVAVNDHRADTPRKARHPRSLRQITRRA